MRLVIYYIIIVLLIGCNLKNSDNMGKWYAPNFGVLTVSGEYIQFYPRGVPPEKWFFDIKESKYKYQGSYFKHCLLNSNSDIYFFTENIDVNSMRLISNDDCISNFPLTSDLILNKIPENIELNFDYFSIIEFQVDKFVEFRLSPSELGQFANISNDFSLEEQLWLLFCSGVTNNAVVDRFESIHLKIVGDNFHVERVLHKALIPSYISKTLDAIKSN